ncbi:hypothetical protein QN277_000184 [Acacia crassicarpa]|uniref:Uncharacterized protein n=1 Tax=Acacia crassicarpa TaxID=499986 RepID=A0AAE1N4L7_9FABA|nr:hypothetical protein QN277_000184 [Acacia crassicarpa]
MAFWSAENATKAYLSAFKMGEGSKEPDVTEFISAIAAGNNSQTMVMVASASSFPDSTILLAMLAAAHQTQGRVICIVDGSHGHLNPTKAFLASNIVRSDQVDFLIGQPQELLTSEVACKNADFVVVDCELESHQEIFTAVCVAAAEKKKKNTVVVGYNAMKCKGYGGGTRTQLLPIGKGLLVTRFGDFGGNSNNVIGGTKHYGASGLGKFRSRWVVKFDKCTGEEHVFRVRLPHDKAVPGPIINCMY